MEHDQPGPPLYRLPVEVLSQILDLLPGMRRQYLQFQMDSYFDDARRYNLGLHRQSATSANSQRSKIVDLGHGCTAIHSLLMTSRKLRQATLAQLYHHGLLLDLPRLQKLANLPLVRPHAIRILWRIVRLQIQVGAWYKLSPGTQLNLLNAVWEVAHGNEALHRVEVILPPSPIAFPRLQIHPDVEPLCRLLVQGLPKRAHVQLNIADFDTTVGYDSEATLRHHPGTHSAREWAVMLENSKLLMYMLRPDLFDTYDKQSRDAVVREALDTCVTHDSILCFRHLLSMDEAVVDPFALLVILQTHRRNDPLDWIKAILDSEKILTGPGTAEMAEYAAMKAEQCNMGHTVQQQLRLLC